ncbi:biotin synthase [Ideonella sp. YS5]
MMADAPTPAAASPAPSAVRFDAHAARRALERLARQPQPPWLHLEAARRMGERLEWIRHQPEVVLDWSGAAGVNTALLSAAYPRAEQLVWREGAMTSAAAAPWWRRWTLGGGAPRSVESGGIQPGEAGLVWSNMRLHFERDPLPMMQAWHRALAPGAFLMFSTLGPGSLSLLRELYAASGWGEAHAPFVDMHDLGDMLVASGFAEPVMDQETLSLNYASPDALLAELRGLGVNAAPGRYPGLRTPRWKAGLLEQLQARADREGRLVLQLELVYGHAFRGADTGPKVEAQTQIALDDMKSMLRKPGRRQ